MKLPCPRCNADIKLRRISPPSDPINKYPAVRPCPSCGAPLLFDLPIWVIPAVVLLCLEDAVFGIYLMNLWGYGHLLGDDGRAGRRSWGTVILTIPLVATILPIMIWVFRMNMRITEARDFRQ